MSSDESPKLVPLWGLICCYSREHQNEAPSTELNIQPIALPVGERNTEPQISSSRRDWRCPPTSVPALCVLNSTSTQRLCNFTMT
jgi:hypothetical protein